ncbi:MAG: endonuclease/exonuclease/phosphatase family protein [Acuticoccus sp.]
MRTCILLLLALMVGASGARADEGPAIRFATFNAALNAREAGGVLSRLEGGDAQARAVAELIQRLRPDVLLLQELDRDAAGRSLAVFSRDYLAVSQNGAAPIDYPFTLYPPSNTGVPLGVDVDGDGLVGGPGDARGFGHHAGQYAFALLSRLPLGAPRTFANLLWRDVPGGLIPASYYGPEARAVLPLSSKTHLVVPVETAAGPVHVLAAHPTPPVFDDARDWNGRRNSDEIRLLADIIDGAAYLVDDGGVAGGLPAGAPFVVMGDLNADPERGEAREGAIAQLLGHARVADPRPASPQHGTATAEFGGGLRVDYVLPSRNAGRVAASGVVWFAEDDAHAALNGASDHRMVYVDLVPGADADAGAAVAQ